LAKGPEKQVAPAPEGGKHTSTLSTSLEGEHARSIVRRKLSRARTSARAFRARKRTPASNATTRARPPPHESPRPHGSTTRDAFTFHSLLRRLRPRRLGRTARIVRDDVIHIRRVGSGEKGEHGGEQGGDDREHGDVFPDWTRHRDARASARVNGAARCTDRVSGFHHKNTKWTRRGDVRARARLSTPPRTRPCNKRSRRGTCSSLGTCPRPRPFCGRARARWHPPRRRNVV